MSIKCGKEVRPVFLNLWTRGVGGKVSIKYGKQVRPIFLILWTKAGPGELAAEAHEEELPGVGSGKCVQRGEGGAENKAQRGEEKKPQAKCRGLLHRRQPQNSLPPVVEPENILKNVHKIEKIGQTYFLEFMDSIASLSSRTRFAGDEVK